MPWGQVGRSAHQDGCLAALLPRHGAQGSWCCPAPWQEAAFDHFPETGTFNSSSTPGVTAPTFDPADIHGANSSGNGPKKESTSVKSKQESKNGTILGLTQVLA